MAQELSLLDIDEVSLVDHPANSSVDPATGRKVPRARVALWKRDEGGNTNLKGEDNELLSAVFNKVIKADGKTYGGKSFPKSDFAFTPDDEPSHWKLRLTKVPGGDPDSGIVGAAAAALSSGGFRGNRAIIPSADLSSVKAKVRAAWKKANADKDESEMPDSIKKQGESMTVEELATKVEKQEGILTSLQAENTFLKNEREVVIKMSKKERKAYASMTPDMQKDFMAADAEKRKTMCDAAMAKMKEKAAEDCMDAALKREYNAAGPVRKAQILAEVIAKAESDAEGGSREDMDKKKKKKSNLKPASGSNDDDEDDEDDDNEDLELRKRDAQIAVLTDRINKSDVLMTQISKKETLAYFTKMAAEKLPNTSGSDVEKGEDLMKVAEIAGGENSQVFKNYLGNLVTADKAMTIFYGEVGKAGAGVIPAEKVFDAKVQEIMKRDKITIGKATERAMTESPELYAAYEQDHRRVLGARS